ncbi:MAG: hypothetical protein ACOX71_00840 [Lachnospiraceae bacterium]|jgi:hypothetical protein
MEASRRVNSRTDERRRRYSYAPGYEETFSDQVVVNRRRNAEAYGRTQRNRVRNRMLSRGFVVFLIVMSVASVVICIEFLKVKSALNTVKNENEVMMSHLCSLRAENDALYEKAGTPDLEVIRDIAMERFGMDYATQDQIIWYNADNSGSVKQYGVIPEAD